MIHEERQKRGVYVEEALCNGCRMCEMMCSYKLTGGEFNPRKARIKVVKLDEMGICLPIRREGMSHCKPTDGKLPPCVEFCPTGALMYCTYQEAIRRRQEWPRQRLENPEYKIRAPWRIEGKG